MLMITTPLTALADTPGGGQSANFPVIKPGGSGYTPSAGIFRDYGFRVTVTTNSPITEAGGSKIVKNSSQARKEGVSFLAFLMMGRYAVKIQAVKDKLCFSKILDGFHLKYYNMVSGLRVNNAGRVWGRVRKSTSQTSCILVVF